MARASRGGRRLQAEVRRGWQLAWLLALGGPLGGGCDDLAHGTRARILVSPPEVVFRSAAPRAEPYQERVTVQNVGSAELEVTSVAVGGDGQYGLASGTPARFTLRPQAVRELFVTYLATDVLLRQGALTVLSADADSPRIVVPVRNELIFPRITVSDCLDALAPVAPPPADGGAVVDGGAVADGGAVVDGGAVADGGASACAGPTDDLLIDFGEVRGGRCREASLTLENGGAAQLTVQAPVFVAGSSPAMKFVGPPQGPGGMVIPPVDASGVAGRRSFRLQFCPQAAISSAEARLLIASDDPRDGQLTVLLSGSSALGRCDIADRFLQPPTTKADMLFVVDNSGSMSDNQANLRQNFRVLADYLQHQTVDFQIGVVTTDNATLKNTATTPRIIYAGDPDPVAEFSANANVGTGGSGDEKGLEFARLAVSEPVIGGANAGFLRADSALEVIVVSDEEDHSPSTVDTYATFFRGLVGPGRVSRFRFSAIVGDVPGGCTGSSGTAEAGVRYADLVTRTAGVLGSICSGSFASTLDAIGRGIGPQRSFRLSHVPDVSLPLLVRTYPSVAACDADFDGTGGRAIPLGGAMGYSYEAATNSITLLSTPPLGTCQKVFYVHRCVLP